MDIPACPRDTDGDGDCGQQSCPFCNATYRRRLVCHRFEDLEKPVGPIGCCPIRPDEWPDRLDVLAWEDVFLGTAQRVEPASDGWLVYLTSFDHRDGFEFVYDMLHDPDEGPDDGWVVRGMRHGASPAYPIPVPVDRNV